MRKRIKLEAFDPATGWPIKVYDSYTCAAADGHKRSAIAQVIAGHRQSHHGLGWRIADATSDLATFVKLFCWEQPGAKVLPLAELQGTYLSWAALPLTRDLAGPLSIRISRRYGTSLIEGPPQPGLPGRSYVQVVVGLVWAA